MSESVPVNLHSNLEEKKYSVVSKNSMRWCAHNARAVGAEFLATAMLLFLGCMTNVAERTLTIPPPIYTAWGFGMTVMFNIQIFGHISGAHMNPAVTLTALINGNISVVLAVAYFIAQCLGSIIGFYLLALVAHLQIPGSGVCVTMPLDGLNVAQSLGIEIGITMALCLLCCASWDTVNNKKQDSMAVKFGLTIAGLSIIAGPLTGAGMNPVRSLAPAIVTGIWTQHYIYWVGPLVASVLASLLYKIMTAKSGEV